MNEIYGKCLLLHMSQLEGLPKEQSPTVFETNFKVRQVLLYKFTYFCLGKQRGQAVDPLLPQIIGIFPVTSYYATKLFLK